MQKEHPHRGPLTDQERAEIRRLTEAGTRQSVIARSLHLTAPTVSRAQRQMGLPTRLAIPEGKILELFRAGWGGYRIAKHLNVCAHCVYKVRAKYQIGQRADGSGTGYATVDEAGFVEAVKSHSDYAKNLAPVFKIGICRAQRLARKTLGVSRLRPGRSSPPLSSDEPLRPCTIERLAERIAYGLFEGNPPRQPIIIAAVVAAVSAKLLAAEGTQVCEAGIFNFAGKLAIELRRHIGSDDLAAQSQSPLVN